MFFSLFTIEVIWAIAVLCGYGISSLVGIVHITLPKTGITFLPPITIFTIPVIHLCLFFH